MAKLFKSLMVFSLPNSFKSFPSWTIVVLIAQSLVYFLLRNPVLRLLCGVDGLGRAG
ncbi:hypothetical protein [Proteus myxofaciens]|uniref:hypothetical protein n=1 Tax=Proteus myxofaciens TaxID=184072 RepID=UPI001428AADE|nr:hypothetical protein [Proteus myxofaciens]